MKINLKAVLLVVGISWIFLATGCATSGSGDMERGEPVHADHPDIVAGRTEQARAAQPDLALFAPGGAAVQPRWRENLDGGDAPLVPGCACLYALPACGGRVVGRSVDECFPDDGVTLQEKTIDNECDTYSNKEYDCEKLLGKGAVCRLQPMTCCGMRTTSAYCHLQIEP